MRSLVSVRLGLTLLLLAGVLPLADLARALPETGGKDFTLLYLSDEDGYLEPCG